MIINTLYCSQMKKYKHFLVTKNIREKQISNSNCSPKGVLSIEVTSRNNIIILKYNNLSITVTSVPKNPNYSGTTLAKTNFITRYAMSGIEVILSMARSSRKQKSKTKE